MKLVRIIYDLEFHPPASNLPYELSPTLPTLSMMPPPLPIMIEPTPVPLPPMTVVQPSGEEAQPPTQAKRFLFLFFDDFL